MSTLKNVHSMCKQDYMHAWRCLPRQRHLSLTDSAVPPHVKRQEMHSHECRQNGQHLVFNQRQTVGMVRFFFGRVMRLQIKLCLGVVYDAAFDLLCAGCTLPLQEGTWTCAAYVIHETNPREHPCTQSCLTNAMQHASLMAVFQHV